MNNYFDKPSLTDTAYQELRNSILIGQISLGDKLVVNDFVKRWNISNTPIKEALNRLVSEGLVEALPRRGMRVRLFIAKEIREFFELRELYETHCCRIAVDKIGDNPQILEAMQETLDKSRDILATRPNFLLQFQLDQMFHMLIVGLCGNDALIKTFDRLHAYIIMVAIYASQKAVLAREEEAYEEHHRILQGLVRRSKTETVAAMRHHLARATEGILRLYGVESAASG